MSQHDRNNDAAEQIVGNVLLLLSLLIFGLFLLSEWLTELLLRYVLNPMLDGLLDRHDGAVILCSAVLWGLVAGGILFPLSVVQGWYGDSYNMLDAWFWTCVLGFLWGVTVGDWIVGSWWKEATSHAPVGYEAVQVLGTPIEIQHIGSPGLDAAPSSRANTGPNDLWLEQMITGGAGWSKER